MTVATHVLHGAYKEEATPRESKRPSCARRSPIESATRLHEVGIASNRGSECHGDSRPCTHHHHTMGVGCKEVGSLTFEATTFVFMTGVKSQMGGNRRKPRG